MSTTVTTPTTTITPMAPTTPINGPLQRNLKALGIIWYREVLRYIRDWTRVITSLMQPLMFLFIFGAGLSSSLNFTSGQLPSGAQLDFQTFLFPGVLSMTVLFTAIFSAVSIVWDREFGFLREVLVAPISRTSVVLGKAFGGSTIAMLQGTIMLIFAPVIGVKLSVGLVVVLMLEMLLLAFTLTSLGIVIASRMKSMEGFQMIMQFLLMPMFFLSGALFPLQGVPAWMQVLTHVDPVAYGMAPVRWALLNGAGVPGRVIDTTQVQFGSYVMPPILDVLVLLVFAAAMLTLAMVSLRRRD